MLKKISSCFHIAFKSLKSIFGNFNLIFKLVYKMSCYFRCIFFITDTDENWKEEEKIKEEKTSSLIFLTTFLGFATFLVLCDIWNEYFSQNKRKKRNHKERKKKPHLQIDKKSNLIFLFLCRFAIWFALVMLFQNTTRFPRYNYFKRLEKILFKSNK